VLSTRAGQKRVRKVFSRSWDLSWNYILNNDCNGTYQNTGS
jgi:hypothetical protein